MKKKLFLSLLFSCLLCTSALGRGFLLQSGAVLELASGAVLELAMSDPTAYTVGSGGDYEAWTSITILPGDSFTWLNSATDVIDIEGQDCTESDPCFIYGEGFTLTGAPIFDGDWWTVYEINFVGEPTVSGDNVKFNRVRID